MTKPLRDHLRLGAVLLAAVLAAGSATSSSGTPPVAPAPAGASGAPPAVAMELPLTLGLWKSNFGAVKIEEDLSQGGPQSGFLQGAWTYQNPSGQQVVGLFAGKLTGNLLEFSWQEPSAGGPPLAGRGYLSFDPSGQSFRGQWWSNSRDRGGEWTGSRGDSQAGADQLYMSGSYGGNEYGGDVYGGDVYGGTVDPYGTPNYY